MLWPDSWAAKQGHACCKQIKPDAGEAELLQQQQSTVAGGLQAIVRSATLSVSLTTRLNTQHLLFLQVH